MYSITPLPQSTGLSIIVICLNTVIWFQETDVTNNLFQLQTTNYTIFPSSLMHFLILHCHASMHCRKDSSGMSLSSVVTAFLMASTRILLSLVQRKVLIRSKIRGNRGVVSSVVMFLSVRNNRMLSSSYPFTFQTYPNLR